MGGHDVAIIIEQGGAWHGAAPVRAIPGVNLNAHGEAVEMDLVAIRHDDFHRNFRGAVVVARLRCECCGGAEQRCSNRFDL